MAPSQEDESVCIRPLQFNPNEKYFTLLQKTLLLLQKIYFTIENFTTWIVFFLQNFSRLKFILAFENR